MTTTNRVSRGIPTGGQFAETAHTEPSVSLPTKERKRNSKGTHFQVTLPDGTVATRTSMSRDYTHAVVVSEEKPELVIKAREAAIATAEARIDLIDRAMADPKFKIRSRNFRPSSPDGDPDKNYRGEPSYHAYEAFLVNPDDPRQPIRATHCNSKGIAGGVYDYETKKYDSQATQPVVVDIKNGVAEERAQQMADIERYKADIEKVRKGTFPFKPAGVARWSSRADLAQKAMTGELNYPNRTNELSVVEVDPA